MSFLKNEDILRVMHFFNPWWTGRPPEVPEFHRLAFDVCIQRLSDPVLKRGVLLAGPRRVGKSTVMLQLARMLIEETSDPRRVFYLSLEHPVLKMITISEILDLYEQQVRQVDAEVYLLLDEVQYSKDWDLHLKIVLDHRPQFRVVATGSAALKQKHDALDSGVGRWTTVPMPTLSFYEFLKIRGAILPEIAPDLRLHNLMDFKVGDREDLAQRFRGTLPDFQRYLLVGGFPETAKSADVDACQRIMREDVVERVLKRDMVALFGIRKISELERLFIYLCFHSGGILSVRNCASEIGTTAATVAGFLDSLESANLIYRLAPARMGGKKALREQNKYYLVDAALRNAVLLHGEEILVNPDELGVIVETAVLRHLYAYYYLDHPRVAYWRDAKTDKEVDVVVTSPKYSIPVEVKYRSSARIDAASGLVQFAGQDPAVKHAYLVTREDKDFGTVDFSHCAARFLKIPAHIFTYLLGQNEHALWERSGQRTPAPARNPPFA